MSSGLEDTPWFWEEALNHSSTIAVFSVYGAIFLIGLAASVHARWTEKDEKEQAMIYSAIRTTCALTFFVYDVTFMCARFSWFINSDDAIFTPYDMGDDGLKWATEKYQNASVETREKYCSYSMDLVLDETDDGGICDFLNWEFTAELVPKGTGFDAGGAKFSIGLGLFLYFLLFWAGFSLKEKVAVDPEKFAEENEIELPEGATPQMVSFAFGGMAQLIFVLLASQQSLVLFPIAGSVEANNYCAIVDAPTSQKRAMCLHRFAVLAVPYGLVCLLLCIIFWGAWQSTLKDNAKMDAEGDEGSCLMCNTPPLRAFWACMFPLLAGYFAFMTAAFFVFWLFGGMVVGVWFTFGSIRNLRDLGAIRVLTSPAASVSGELARGISYLVFLLKSKPVSTARNVCPEVEDCSSFLFACSKLPGICCRSAYSKSRYGARKADSTSSSLHGGPAKADDGARDPETDVPDLTSAAVFVSSAEPAPTAVFVSSAEPAPTTRVLAIPEQPTMQPKPEAPEQSYLRSNPPVGAPQAWHNQPSATSMANVGVPHPGLQNQPSLGSQGWPTPGQFLGAGPPPSQQGFFPGQPGVVPAGGMMPGMHGGIPFYYS